ncbi:receptor-interacting serine/threonine-protein kinase 4-like [Ptychodera flava]|uniref:receptor-interacting serine/threonine-protein kinase 4-like n=1 Tax=Ptychodera flava TaxID=63121 RepID=UPI00396A1902
MEDIPSAMEYAERIGIIPKATHPSSLIAVFECTTHEALETLWNDNNGGTLKRVFEKDIVTERVLTNFNASTISLITTIETWQYQKCALEIKYGIKEYSPSYYDNGEELEEYDDSFEISERMSESSEEIRMADELAFGSLFGDDPEETMTSVDDQPSLLSIECDGKHPPTLNPKVYLSEVIGGFDEIRPTSPSTNLSKYLGLVRVHQGHRLKTLLKRKPPILGLIGINKVLVNGSLQSCLRTQDDEERFDIKELQHQMDIYGSDTRFLVDQKSESLVVRGLTPSVNVTTVEDYVRVVDQLVNRWLDSACRLKKEKAERVIANNLLHFANDQVRTLEQKVRMGSDDNIKISRIVTQQNQTISLFEERMRSLKTHISQKKEEGEGLVDTDELLKYLEVEILQMLDLPQSSTETHQRLQTVEMASKSTLSDTGTELPREMTLVGPTDIKSKSKIRKNWSDILIAAVNKDLSTVMSLIQQGEDVNAATEDGYTALHIAAAAGDLDMVKCVVEGGIDKDAGEKLKWTALHLASWNGHLNVVNYLIDAGADKEARNVDGSTALHWAARNGYVDIVKLLISKGADKNAIDKKRRTPQHFAAFYGHATTVKTFIDAGVNSEAKDVSEHTPLYDAAEQGKQDVINVLTDAGINKEATAKDKWTPLHAAAAKGHGKVTKLLIDAGSNMEAGTETDGYTVLHVAVHKGRAEVVQILLSAGANKEANAKDGYTPLLVASENGHVVVVKILVEAGVNVAACTLSDNHTSLHLAAKKGHNQVVKILVETRIDKEARTKVCTLT